jgi:uncharacterized protein
MFKATTFLLVLAVLASAGLLIYSGKSEDEKAAVSEATVKRLQSSPSTSPSPFPFQELTVPFLRNREYKSKLGELEKNYENANYTAYLTSYDSDGLNINALFTEPKGEKPEGGWPGIIFIHGYIPPGQYRTTQNYYDYVDYLARNGFAVLKIDLRGHGDSEGEPGGAYYSSDYIIDTLNARSALQNSGIVHPDKIGLWGHSMAGNVVLRSLAVKPEIPAASIWAGAVYTYKDFAQFGIQDGSYRPPADQTERQRRRKLLMDTYGEPKDGNPFWDLVAATNYLNDYKGAIQLNHAVNDDVVNIGYSRGLNEILNRTSVIQELNEYQSGGHNINGQAFSSAMKNTVDFFKKYLD